MVSANVTKRYPDVVIDGVPRPVAEDGVVEVNIYGKRIVPAPALATAIGTKTLKIETLDGDKANPFLHAFINCLTFVRNVMRESFDDNENHGHWKATFQDQLCGYFVLDTYNDMHFVYVGNHEVRFRLDDDAHSAWMRPFHFSAYYESGYASDMGVEPNWKVNSDRQILFPKLDVKDNPAKPIKAINIVSENIEVTNMFVHKFGADLENYVNDKLQENSSEIINFLLQ